VSCVSIPAGALWYNYVYLAVSYRNTALFLSACIKKSPPTMLWNMLLLVTKFPNVEESGVFMTNAC